MADTYFAGLRGTDDLVSNERPEDWRAGILRLFPNGMAPLTALTALMPSEKTSDVHFHWWEEQLSTQRAALQDSGVYLDAACTSAYTTGGVAGDVVYFKVAKTATGDDVPPDSFRAGHQVLLRDADNYNADTTAYILSVLNFDANDVVISAELLEDDPSTTLIAGCDTVLIIGSGNAQGGTRPEAVTKSPTERDNYVQIFRDSVDLTRTLMETSLRTEDAYLKAKRDCLEFHSIQMEKAFLFGKQRVSTGDNGKPLTFTDGLLVPIKARGVVEDYETTTDTDYTGQTWLEAGEEWIDEHLEEMFRFGSNERLAFCGSGALLGIQKLVKNNAHYSISKGEGAYGIRVVEWETPFGMITLKTHPLFSYESTNRNSMVLFEPANIKYRFVTDTTFYPDVNFQKGGGSGKDGIEEEFLTEAGLQYHLAEGSGWLNGVGKDNTVA